MEKLLLQLGKLAEAATQFEIALFHKPMDQNAKEGLSQARGKTPINVTW